MHVVASVRPSSCSAEVVVVARCLARVTIPASATNPFPSGGTVKRTAVASGSMYVCAHFPLGFLGRRIG